MFENRGRFNLADGQIYFEVAGDGEPVVFLHGFGLDLRMWEPQFRALRNDFRLIRYDLRGFGRSSLPPAGPYAHEDDLNSLLTHLKALPAHVVGLSMGGRMALRFAASYPASIRSLVLADTALDGFSWSADWQARWNRICEAARAGRIEEAKMQWLEHPLLATTRCDPHAWSLLEQLVRDYSGWHWHNADTARVPAPPLAARLGAIHTPTLVVTGAKDLPDFQSLAEFLTGKLPKGRRRVIEKAGHMVNLETPDEFNAAMMEFWHSLETGEPAS